MATASPSANAATSAIVTGAALPGSLAVAAQQHGGSLAKAWLDVRAVLVCDVSASMSETDATAGQPHERRSRWEAMSEQLAGLQAQFAGKTAVVAFSNTASLAL